MREGGLRLSGKKISDYDYLYLTSALRAKEPKMLTLDRINRMLEAPSFEEAAKLLMDCGYVDMSGMKAAEIEKALSVHRKEAFEDIRELIPEKEIVDVFSLKYDYHNVKVLLKAESAGVDGKYLLSGSGTVSVEILTEAYYSQDEASLLPSRLAKALDEARSVIKRTENPQLADFILDRAYFDEMRELAGKLYAPFLSEYVRLAIDGANLRTVVRTLRIGRGESFLRSALISGGNIDVGTLAESAYTESGFLPIYDSSEFRAAAELGVEAAKGGKLTYFEKECDSVQTRFFVSAAKISFGAPPVIAYIAALENEITAVRMILTGKLSGIEPSLIRERLRDINA